MTQYTVGQQSTMVYYSERTDDHSSRAIIPTAVPVEYVKAIDVEHLTESERTEMETLFNEYQAYVERKLATLFNFEQWVEHTQNVFITPVWKTFKLSGIR